MARRNCKKNQRTMYYSLYSEKIPILDEEGNDTFETTVGYAEPVEFKASISTGKSDAEDSPFGSDVSYDRVIVTTDMSLPIDENSIIWKDNIPTFDDNGMVIAESADYKVASKPLDGLDSLKIAVKYVKKSVVKEVTDNTDSNESDGF